MVEINKISCGAFQNNKCILAAVFYNRTANQTPF